MTPSTNDPKKTAEAKQTKRVANGIVVVMGLLLYADLFAQPACGPESTAGGAVVDAAGGGAVDAPNVDGAAISPAIDAAPTVDGATPADCFALAAGTHYLGNYGCGLGDTTLSVTTENGAGYKLAPFGYMNTAGQTFTPKAGAPNEATASNVSIYEQPNHTCTLTCTPGAPKPTLSVSCVGPAPDAGGNPPMCTELYRLPADVDGGASVDGGVSVDASAPVDAGASIDAGAPVDAAVDA